MLLQQDSRKNHRSQNVCLCCGFLLQFERVTALDIFASEIVIIFQFHLDFCLMWASLLHLSNTAGKYVELWQGLCHLLCFISFVRLIVY